LPAKARELYVSLYEAGIHEGTIPTAILLVRHMNIDEVFNGYSEELTENVLTRVDELL
jgi:hypothetical protein